MNTDEDIEIVDEDAKGDAKVEKLKKKLEIYRQEKEEYLKGWQRAKADYINLDRSSAEREARAASSAEERVFREILDLSDSLERAFSENVPDSPWARGIKNTHERLKSIFKKHEIREIEALGKPFDPNLHEVLELVEVFEKDKDDRVIEILQKGYMIKDRLLRPARVKVANYKES